MTETQNAGVGPASERDRNTIVVPVWSWHISGTNTFALRLVAALKSRLGFHPEILCGHPPPRDLAPCLEELDVSVFVGPSDPAAFIRFGKSRLRGRAPLVFVAKSPFDFEMARVLPPQTRLWFWSHGLGTHWEAMIRVAMGFGAEICIPNQGQYLKVHRKMPHYEKCHPTQLWVDPVRVRPATDRAPILLVHSGRLDQTTKRVESGIELAELLRQKKVPFRLDYLGEGPHRAALAHAIRKRSLEPWVRLLPPVPPHLLGEKLGEYHLVLSFSKRESFGLAVLEGMAAGLTPLCLAPERGLDFLHGRPDLNALVPNLAAMADRIEGLVRAKVPVADIAARRALAERTQARFGIDAVLPLLKQLAAGPSRGNPAPTWLGKPATLFRLWRLRARAARRARAFRKREG